MASPRIRVAQVVGRLERGGTQNIVLELMRGLDRTRFDPVLIHLQKPNHYADTIAAAGWELHHIPSRRTFRARDAWSVARAMRPLALDIVHTHADFANFVGRAGALLAGVPHVVCHYHGHYAHRMGPRFRALEGALAPFTDSIAACSQAVAATVRRELPIGNAPVNVLLNGIDLSRFLAAPARRAECRANLGLNDGVFHIVHTGRLVPHKAPGVLLEALARAGERLGPWRATFIGGGELEADIRRQAGELESAGRVPPGAIRFVGWSDDIAGFLAAADCFALCSLHEGFGLAILEALAADVPVIATDIPGPTEIVAHEHDSLLVPPSDPAALAEALVRVRREPGLAGRLILGGRESAARFSLRRLLDETMALYEAVARDGDRAAPLRHSVLQRLFLRTRLARAAFMKN